MKIIDSGLHGIMDYLTGIFLLISPWLLHFANNDSAQNVPMIIGGSLIVYSVFTRYEVGAIKLVPFHIHLVLDFIAGASLAFSPFIYGFRHEVMWPHIICGIFLAGISVTTQKYHEKTQGGRRLFRQPPGREA